MEFAVAAEYPVGNCPSVDPAEHCILEATLCSRIFLPMAP